MDRRTVLKMMAATALAGATAPVFAKNCKQKVGVQLYTVRSEMAKNVEATLNAVAALGYGEVEFAGYFDHSAKETQRMLKDAGLKSPSSHLPLRHFREGFEETVEFAAEVGHKYLILPWLPREARTLDGYRAAAETLNKAGEIAKKAGLYVAYHNHEFEFETVEGQIPFDILMNETDAATVKLQLDLHWLHVAGVDPLDLIVQAPGRVPLVHVKDRTADGIMTEVGNGVIDFGRVFAKASDAGLKHFMVEHDKPEKAMESIATSIKNLKATFPWFCA